VRNEDVFKSQRGKEISKTIKGKKDNWICHMLRRNCLLLKHIIEGKIDGRIQVMGRRGRKHKLLLDERKGKKECCQFKEEAPDLIL
jgi:hypothetical protein